MVEEFCKQPQRVQILLLSDSTPSKERLLEEFTVEANREQVKMRFRNVDYVDLQIPVSDNTPIQARVWNNEGRSKFANINKNFLNRLQIAIFLYLRGNKSSVDYCLRQAKKVEDSCKEGLKFIFVEYVPAEVWSSSATD